MIGQTFSHYQIIEELGHGAMGVVYLAEDLNLKRRQVAIKTLNAIKGSDNQNLRRRFQREAEAAARLSHPHIATIHELGRTPEGDPFIVMELVKGQNLAELMEKEPLTIPRALQIVREVAEALGEAHRHGIIHRDIKPSNVAINQRGEVKVLDFGLAKEIDLVTIGTIDPERQTLLNTQTREGMIVGTPMYLSPEQALSVEVDPRSDLFSLGAVLYECIAGKPPFLGSNALEICNKVAYHDPVPPSQFNKNVSRDLERITLKALAKKQEERYQTADELIADLDQTLAELQGHSGHTVTRLISPAPNTQQSSVFETLSDIFKKPTLSIGYVVAGLVLLSLLGFGVWRLSRPKPHQPNAEAQQFFEKGVTALHEGTYYRASRMLERAVAADEKFALAHARLSEAFTELDYTDRAKDELLSANRLVSNSAALEQLDALYFDAIGATITRDLTGAIKSYKAIADMRGHWAPAEIDLGRAYENNDEIENALASYQQASETDSNNPTAFLRLGILYGRMQDVTKANAAFDRAESLYKDSDNFEGSAEVFFQRGSWLGQLSKLPEATAQAQKSHDIAKFADNKHQQVRALLLLGSIAYSSGDTGHGQDLVKEGLDLARGNDMETLATQGLLDLGYALIIRRSYDDAENYIKQAFELAQHYKEKRNEARANLLLGTLYIQKENVERGSAYLDQALSFYQEGGYRREISRCMMMIGRAKLLRGDFDGSMKILDEQLKLAKLVEDPGQLARSQAEIGALLSKQDLYPQALVRYTESYDLNKQLNNPLNIAFALLNRADMLARLGKYDEANAALSELNPYLDKLSEDNRYKLIWSAWCYLIRAQMALSKRQFAETKSYCQDALKVITRGRTAVGDAKAALHTEVAIKETLGLAHIFSAEIGIGLRLCEDAAKLASSADQPSTDELGMKLMLAEAFLESGDAKRSLAITQEMQPLFANGHHEECEWRTSVTAARGSQQLGNVQGALAEVLRARSVLSHLQAKWGPAFDAYSERTDIQRQQKFLQEIASNN